MDPCENARDGCSQVIVVTRLNGPKFAVNPDLVQRIDSAPDTILTLVDGTKYILAESMTEVIELVAEFRSQLIARAQAIQMVGVEEVGVPQLSVVRPAKEEER